MPDTNRLNKLPSDDAIPLVGVIHGRFQVLHNDHLKYLLAGKVRCKHLVVGITNPDPTLTREDSADPKRTRLISNPLTYFERYTMVGAALVEAGVSPRGFLGSALPDSACPIFTAIMFRLMRFFT